MVESSLEDLAKDNISEGSTFRLKFVIDSINEANNLKNDLTWNSHICEGLTIEELLGGIIEAENLLERFEYKENRVNELLEKNQKLKEENRRIKEFIEKHTSTNPDKII